MKKSMFLVIVCLSILLSACAESSPPEHVPFDQLSFETEENPDYIGSYYLTRTNELNASWEEWGEWTPIDFSTREVCFGSFSFDDFGVFRARSDYNWIEVLNGDNYCLKLEKRK